MARFFGKAYIGRNTHVEDDIEYMNRRASKRGHKYQEAWRRLKEHLGSMKAALSYQKSERRKEKEQMESERRQEQEDWKAEENLLVSHLETLEQAKRGREKERTKRLLEKEKKETPMIEIGTQIFIPEILYIADLKQRKQKLDEEVAKKDKKISAIKMALRRERDRATELEKNKEDQSKELKAYIQFLDKEIDRRTKKISMLSLEKGRIQKKWTKGVLEIQHEDLIDEKRRLEDMDLDTKKIDALKQRVRELEQDNMKLLSDLQTN